VGITDAANFALAVAAFLLLFMWQTPPWLAVILSAAAGALHCFRACSASNTASV